MVDRKAKKKNISLGVIHIKVTFNNTIVTLTDIQGNSVLSCSSGELGFKGAKKSTPFAAQLAVEKLLDKAKDTGLKTVSIKIKGPGSQRESALRAVFSKNLIVTTISDVSSVAHNGCRPPKRRRV
jgi:small subunit ribosomal protein S11